MKKANHIFLFDTFKQRNQGLGCPLYAENNLQNITLIVCLILHNELVFCYEKSKSKTTVSNCGPLMMLRM